MPISYLNGRYLPHHQAKVSVDDRGYVFSDGVYEVSAVRNGKLIDWKPHIKRLRYSLDEIRMDMPMTDSALRVIAEQIVSRNALKYGFIYIQVTRGVAPRAHAFPKVVKPAVLVSVLSMKPPTRKEYEKGVAVQIVKDERWARRDIKTISLLPNVLAKQQAIDHKAKEAWQEMPNGYISDGSSTNAFIITDDGIIRTHPANENILGGITRMVVLDLAKKEGMKIDETPFTRKEAEQAAEAFLTSTTAGPLPVVTINGKNIGNGKPGKLTQKLVELYEQHCNEAAG